MVFVLWDYFAVRRMTLGENVKELERAVTGIRETESEEGGDLNLFSIDQGKAIVDFLFSRYLFLQNLFLISLI